MDDNWILIHDSQTTEKRQLAVEFQLERRQVDWTRYFIWSFFADHSMIVFLFDCNGAIAIYST